MKAFRKDTQVSTKHGQRLEAIVRKHHGPKSLALRVRDRPKTIVSKLDWLSAHPMRPVGEQRV